MPSNQVTLQLLAFLALTGGVAANVFFMQASERRAHGGQPSASEAWNIAAIEAAEFGDTGSIGHPGARQGASTWRRWPRAAHRRKRPASRR